jgi:hypothetical protein
MHSAHASGATLRKLPSRLRASRARRVEHPKKQIPRPPMGTSAADVADGGLGLTPDTNEHKTPGPRNDGGRPGQQRTDPRVQTTYRASGKANYDADWKAELHERKSLRSADKNRSARPELQKCFRTHPSERMGHPKKQTTMPAGRRSCTSAKASGLPTKTGRPDLSYKMHSDPPFRKGGAPEKTDSSPAD